MVRCRGGGPARVSQGRKSGNKHRRQGPLENTLPVMAVDRVHDYLGAEHPSQTIPGFYNPRPGIQIGASMSHDVSDTQLKLMEQLGVDWAHINVNDPDMHNVESYVALKKKVAEYGMQVYRIAKHDVQ